MSQQRLSDACRQSTGISAKALILEQLMVEAKRHLCHSEMPISEIAARLGYDDPLYFSRAFKHAVGHSPRTFRSSLPS